VGCWHVSASCPLFSSPLISYATSSLTLKGFNMATKPPAKAPGKQQKQAGALAAMMRSKASKGKDKPKGK
jgi:hypothetical protein